MATVFFSYSHADEDLRDQIEKQLAVLKRQGVIETWHDRRIPAGAEIDHSISAQLETADIILLLVSSDFLNSDYCYDREMLRAMARHEAGDAIVIPVILRACDWHAAPFGKLMAVPTDGKAITQWPDRDEAMLLVARAVREAASRHGRSQPPAVPTMAAQPVPTITDAPRSSNLRLAKKFTQRDKDQFRDETFDFMSKFFENSLAELEDRNPGIEGRFRRVTSDRFTAVAYRNGDAVARCTVFMGGGHFVDGIAFSHSETESNGYNESLSVHSDDQSLFLRGMGMSHFRGRNDDDHLTMQGAAELYWSMFIERLQR